MICVNVLGVAMTAFFLLLQSNEEKQKSLLFEFHLQSLFAIRTNHFSNLMKSKRNIDQLVHSIPIFVQYSAETDIFWSNYETKSIPLELISL